MRPTPTSRSSRSRRSNRSKRPPTVRRRRSSSRARFRASPASPRALRACLKTTRNKHEKGRGSRREPLLCLSKKPRRVSRPQARKRFDLFSAATCAWQKTLCAERASCLSAFSGQFKAQSAANPSRKSGEAAFSTGERRGSHREPLPFLM